MPIMYDNILLLLSLLLLLLLHLLLLNLLLLCLLLCLRLRLALLEALSDKICVLLVFVENKIVKPVILARLLYFLYVFISVMYTYTCVFI